ncbi:MAG: hypothetical protein GY861_17515 [bacterium]|nr:hypothetical protein [bacterium]
MEQSSNELASVKALRDDDAEEMQVMPMEKSLQIRLNRLERDVADIKAKQVTKRDLDSAVDKLNNNMNKLLRAVAFANNLAKNKLIEISNQSPDDIQDVIQQIAMAGGIDSDKS